MLIDNLTDAVFNQRIVDAHNNGERYIYTIVDEIEALKKVTSRGTVDEVGLLIRKAFDNSLAGQERVGADSVSGIAPLRWNFNARTAPRTCSTFYPMNSRMISTARCAPAKATKMTENPPCAYGSITHLKHQTMRKITEIIIHCSATPTGRHHTIEDLDQWHRQRGFKKIGYHYVIYLDGSVHTGRPIEEPGSHRTRPLRVFRQILPLLSGTG